MSRALRGMRVGAAAYVKFPGQPAVLKALRAAGTWAPADVARWGRANGGTAKTYAALAHYVETGRVSYERNRWTFVARYAPNESQFRGEAC